MELPSDQATLQGPPSKRRRVALACDICRTRKSRCDGIRPQCGMCKDLGFECVYTPAVTATNVIVQKDYLQNLESRMKSLEDNLSTMRSDMTRLAAHMSSKSPPSDGQPEPCHQPVVDLAGPEDPTDAMGAVTFADEEECGYFGPSSNIAFLRHLSRAVSHSESNQQEISSPRMDKIAYDGGFVSATRPPSPVSGRTPTAVHAGLATDPLLPSSEETLQLIRRYFYDTGLLFPYIHPPTFFETYHQFKNNAKKVRRTWLGLLNIMLAMAKVTAVSARAPAELRIKESTRYYRQALNLCRGEILRGTTLEVVQYLLLMGQYLQGTQKSVQAWTVHGLAVKAALQLGLHSKDASQAFPPLEREIRKRTWFACVVLDRTLSMTFGRPPAIPDNYVQLDLPIVPSISEGQPVVDDETIRQSIYFFNHTITLYKQMGNIIDRIYGQNLGCEPSLSVGETMGRVLSIENQLLSWVMALPNNLRQLSLQDLREEVGQSNSQPRLFPLKFRVILTLRYLHIQILLHRPILVKFLDASHASGLEPGEERVLNEIGYSSMKKCVESAMGIIDMIHELVCATGWQRDLLGAWWYSLYYSKLPSLAFLWICEYLITLSPGIAFNAALVIIGATWVQRTRQPVRDFPSHQLANIELYPGRAVATLRQLDMGNRMVDRCRYYLEQLISILHLEPEDSTDTAPIDLGLAAMGSSTTDGNFPSFGIECGEFMLDDLFINITQGPALERW
ncbi:C6 transcription factor [Aspergillus flavus]|nr:C6 transcription factor [Aspergillus flavus]